jgi:hypothetical protein
MKGRHLTKVGGREERTLEYLSSIYLSVIYLYKDSITAGGKRGKEGRGMAIHWRG